MKIFATTVLILLNISNYAQQNYFSKRYTFGCGQNGQKILQEGSNYILITSVSCLGPGLKSVFVRLDSSGNVMIEKIHGVNLHHYFSGAFAGLIRLRDSAYV